MPFIFTQADGSVTGQQAGRQWFEQTYYARVEWALNTLSKPLQTMMCT